jgi:hypothetical protein
MGQALHESEAAGLALSIASLALSMTETDNHICGDSASPLIVSADRPGAFQVAAHNFTSPRTSLFDHLQDTEQPIHVWLDHRQSRSALRVSF